jgi:mannose-6-phosphate isomerase-like protein (cupin superfamily)
MLNSVGKVDKGWGNEKIWVSNSKYCGKFLNFKSGAKFSMHFHAEKDETWYVLSGVFELIVIDTITATRIHKVLNPGDVHRNSPLMPHQLICMEEGSILEVSTADYVNDNYRVEQGDSQCAI